MRKLIFTSLSVAAMLTASSVNAKQIEFHIEGIQSAKGKLYIQLFNGKQNYAKGNAINATVVKAVEGKTKVTFAITDAGEYALRYFHDENNNGQLETNLFGMPTEGYGYSNDAQPKFGPAKYDQIKFVVNAQDDTVVNRTRVIY